MCLILSNKVSLFVCPLCFRELVLWAPPCMMPGRPWSPARCMTAATRVRKNRVLIFAYYSLKKGCTVDAIVSTWLWTEWHKKTNPFWLNYNLLLNFTVYLFVFINFLQFQVVHQTCISRLMTRLGWLAQGQTQWPPWTFPYPSIWSCPPCLHRVTWARLMARLLVW